VEIGLWKKYDAGERAAGGEINPFKNEIAEKCCCFIWVFQILSPTLHEIKLKTELLIK